MLAALGNAALLLVATGAIAVEAVRRFGEPAPVEGGAVVAVALVGIVVNTGTALLFAAGRTGDVNIRGAFLHMAADAAVSAGVVVSGLVIIATGWDWLDPATSLAVSAVILVGTWGLLREAIDLSLDAVPEGIDPAAVEAYLAGLPGVCGVHDLHIWGMSTTEAALTAHLVAPGGGWDDDRLGQTARELHDRFDIEHATLQVERGDPAHPCLLTAADAV
jgi:cobalt-zinc-cadmium efflux system protein